MKKLSSLIFLFILTPVLCFSQLKLSARTGYLGSQIKEILLSSSEDDAQINSLLEWKTFAAPVVLVDAEYKFKEHFIIGAGGFYTIPLSYGRLEDFDYMNIFSTGTDERTHYSKHDNKLANYYSINAFFGAGGTIFQNLNLSAVFSFTYTYYGFSAYNGYKQYGQKLGTVNGHTEYSPWNADIPKTDMEGKIITLGAQKLYFGIGTRLDYSLTDRLNFILKLNVMPVLFGDTLDTHHKRNNPYTYFELNGELAFDSSLLLEYKLKDSLAFTAGLDFFASTAEKGIPYQSSTRELWQQLSNACGVKQTTYRVLIGISYFYEK